jgi:hypothetical protein
MRTKNPAESIRGLFNYLRVRAETRPIKESAMQRLLSVILTGTLCGAGLIGVGLAQDQSQPANPNPQSTTPQTTPAQDAPEQPTTPTQTGATPSQQIENQQTPQAPSGQAAQPSQPNSTQSANSPMSANATQTPRIAPGSVIPVELTKTVDAKKAKSGDEVVAKVTMDLKSTTGQVIVPKDTKVIGHVTEAQARNKEQKSSEVGIAFDRAVMKDGDVPLPMSIQAIIAPPKSSASNSSGGNAEPTSAGSNPNAGASAAGGRPSSMSGSNQPSPNAPTSAPTGDNSGNQPAASSSGAMPQITGKTQGVIGIADISLASATNAGQGSVVSSGKNNVKLEDGTFMLLRVNQ